MIYFDYAATSIKRNEILEYILKNKENFDGNPDSLHTYGRKAKKILEDSRRKIAKSIKADSNDIIFTSSASESNNTILSNFKDDLIITSKIEHDSILNAVNKDKTIYLDVDKDGFFTLDDLKEKMTSDVKLVSLMFVNNEVGSIEPVKEIGKYLKERDVFFHIDCVQAYGHIDIDVNELACNSLSLSGHKIGGINSFGILYANKSIKPLIRGGEQEKNRRAGTSFVMGAYSMAESIEKTIKERGKIKELKTYFVEKLKESNFIFEINGSLDNSSNHILNLYFPYVKNEFLLTFLDMHGVCISVGSACRAGSIEASNVIKAMYNEDRAMHSVRFSFGFTNTKEDIDYTFEILKKVRGIDGEN
ncbi:cysteine desulfurase [Anaerococcus sp. AGMB00486]|uniref:Cysteine desulfurase n=2 Tax=Anaerococcus TaxID=165779 RepID=A0ABX2N8D4_9FIRM|nr:MULTISPECIES: cysteine desulfurase family protein [Anaerococcus]MDY3006669.1 cysteine desulfurase family protein [Anaerococcus porci]MSS77262.1 cysteine desulfurase [Anaerococcus porci]NVF10935.1 cysteine desulfurase [Anaerococcus faecalis]